MENTDRDDVLFSMFISAAAKDNAASGNYGPFGNAETASKEALADAENFAEEFREWFEDSELERQLGRPFEDWRRMLDKLTEDYGFGERVKALIAENPGAFKRMLLANG